MAATVGPGCVAGAALAITRLAPSLEVLHLLREIGREGAWMLGFRDRALGRVHVWVHRLCGLGRMSSPRHSSARREVSDAVLCVVRHREHVLQSQLTADVLEGSNALQVTLIRAAHGKENVVRQ